MVMDSNLMTGFVEGRGKHRTSQVKRTGCDHDNNNKHTETKSVAEFQVRPVLTRLQFGNAS